MNKVLDSLLQSLAYGLYLLLLIVGGYRLIDHFQYTYIEVVGGTEGLVLVSRLMIWGTLSIIVLLAASLGFFLIWHSLSGTLKKIKALNE